MKYLVSLAAREHQVSIDDNGTVTLDGDPAGADVRHLGGDSYSVLIKGQSTRVLARKVGSTYQVLLGSVMCEATVESERDLLMRKYARSADREFQRREVRAPMPALVIRVEVNVGDSVHAGQGLVVLEAMKMENELKAQHDGKVKEVYVTQGQPVEKGEKLLVLE